MIKRIFPLLIAYFIHVKCAPPQQRAQLGPCVGMDCMHGVLMHGDDDQGHDHNGEDKFRVTQENLEAATGSDTRGPCTGMNCLHGALMHKDAQDGQVEHMHEKIGPEKEIKQAGPGEGMDFLHGVMMHGDNRPGKDHDHDHRELTKPPAGKDGKAEGPCVGMDCLHGVLMHGDEDDGKDHSDEHLHEKQKLQEKLGTKFQAPDIEAAIHGAGTDDHVHSHDKKPEIDEKHKGVPSVSDPRQAVHGNIDEQFQLGEAQDDENDDYRSWLKVSKGKKKEDDSGGFLGFSFPFISDSFLDEIEILKRRYLPKFWGSNDHREEGVARKEDNEVHELLSDLDVIGDTGPIKEHNHGHHPKDTKAEGSGVKHDEG